MAEINEIKQKFNQLQSNVTKLSNLKIGMESEIKTIDEDLNDLGKKLLEATGKSSIEEAFTYYKEQNTLLEEKKTKISSELDTYLKIDEDTSGLG